MLEARTQLVLLNGLCAAAALHQGAVETCTFVCCRICSSGLVASWQATADITKVLCQAWLHVPPVSLPVWSTDVQGHTHRSWLCGVPGVGKAALRKVHVQGMRSLRCSAPQSSWQGCAVSTPPPWRRATCVQASYMHVHMYRLRSTAWPHWGVDRSCQVLTRLPCCVCCIGQALGMCSWALTCMQHSVLCS